MGVLHEYLFSLQVWDDVICKASKNVEVLKEIDIVKQLASILKTNVRACKALNHAYVIQLGRIYLDMLNVYKVSLKRLKTTHKRFTLRFLSGYVREYNSSYFDKRRDCNETAIDKEHAGC